MAVQAPQSQESRDDDHPAARHHPRCPDAPRTAGMSCSDSERLKKATIPMSWQADWQDHRSLRRAAKLIQAQDTGRTGETGGHSLLSSTTAVLQWNERVSVKTRRCYDAPSPEQGTPTSCNEHTFDLETVFLRPTEVADSAWLMESSCGPRRSIPW